MACTFSILFHLSLEHACCADNWEHHLIGCTGRRAERASLLVIIIRTCTMATHMNLEIACNNIMSSLQPIVSALFVIEITGVLTVHLFYSPSQCRLFYTNSYYWYLLVIAVCSMIASIPVDHLYNPQMVSSGLAIFQVGLYVD